MIERENCRGNSLVKIEAPQNNPLHSWQTGPTCCNAPRFISMDKLGRN